MEPLLRLEDVDTWYGQMHILQGVSLEVGAGELVCLLGGNASGKSTTLKTALGLARPRAVPHARRARRPARRHAVGRRAADARGRQGADEQAAPAAHGRAVDGPVAAAGRADLRADPAGARLGRGHAGGRAEREHGAGGGRSRLRPADRQGRAGGSGARAARPRGPEEGISWQLVTCPAACVAAFPFSNTRSTSIAARRARSPTASAPPISATSTTGTSAARPGSTGSS